MSEIIYLAYGALGGLSRGLVGALKNGSTAVDYKKITLNVVGAAFIGAVVGLIVDVSLLTAVVSGYAGIDLIESLIKSKQVIKA